MDEYTIELWTEKSSRELKSFGFEELQKVAKLISKFKISMFHIRD